MTSSNLADHRSGPCPRSAGAAATVALTGPLLIVALCWLRSPQMMVQGRFWAEDSMFFGHMAASHSFWEKVFYVYKGHLELIGALSHAVASYLNPKMAPLLTGSAGLLIECSLGYLLVYFRQDLAIRLPSALAICALLVVSPCASEHYLNVLNSQWLTSAILFLLINLPERRLERHPAVIVLATLALGMSGLASSALLPIAALYAACWRSRPHALISAALLVCCCIQGGVIVTHGLDSRFQPLSPSAYVVAPFLQIVVKHLMGVDAESHLAEWFRNGPMATGGPSPFLVLPLGLLAWIASRIYQDRLSHTGLLLLSFLFVTLFNEVGAIGDRNNMVGVYMMRYFFLPSFIVALILARSKPTARAGWLYLAHGALFATLAVSSIDFFDNGYNASLVTLQHSWRWDIDGCRTHPGPCRIDISPGSYEIEFPAGTP